VSVKQFIYTKHVTCNNHAHADQELQGHLKWKGRMEVHNARMW